MLSKTNIIGMVLLIIISSSCIFAQTISYKETFMELVNDAKSESDFFNIAKDFFKSLDDIQLPIALADISEDMDTHTISHLLGSIQLRFNSVTFRNNILNEIGQKKRSESFKIATLDVIKNIIIDNNDSDELNVYSAKTKDIAIDDTYSNNLRKYAASITAFSQDYEVNKKILVELISVKNIYVKNGAAISINRMYEQNSSKEEINYWVDMILANIDLNVGLENNKSMIITLGKSNTEKSKKYLLDLLGKANNEIVALSLCNYSDIDVTKDMFKEFGENNTEYNIEKELLLTNYVKNNFENIKLFSQSKNDDEKVLFIKGLRLINKENIDNKTEDRLKIFLTDKSEIIRYETIKSIHHLLPFEEEKKLYYEHIKNETSSKVKELIYSYIGYIK